MHSTAFDAIPLPAVFIGMLAITLIAIWVGRLVGQRSRARAGDESPGPVGAVVGATSGLLAFLLAFTFGMTASRFDTRKGLLLDEVNAIGTAYLRASLLQDPHRAPTRRLLREYVDLRVDGVANPIKIAHVLERSQAIHAELWSHAVAMAQADRSSEIDSLYIAALNDVIDFHTKRVTVAMQYRTPATIWVLLLLVTVLAMGSLGYDFGLSGGRRIGVALVLAITFASVILLIADLDRPGEGYLKVSQQPMLDLQQQQKSGPD